MSPKITLSVVVSSFNQEHYIEDCLDSILRQKLDIPFEIVISDDCSTDGTPTIIARYAEKYGDKIRLLKNTENVGAARNYFRLHNAASGKYVAHMDGDDIMLPGKLQAQVNVLEENPDCALVFHRARYFNDSRSYVDETGSLPPGDPLVFFSIDKLAQWGTLAVHSSYMYRRSTRKTKTYVHDVMEWYFSMEHLDAPGATACFINRLFVEYRCNENGQAYLSSRKGRQRSYRVLIGHVIDRFHSTKDLRAELYAHAFVSILAYQRNVRIIDSSMLLFLLRHGRWLSFQRIRETMRIRRAVGPQTRIR